jgi:membrane fusion protein (multidrug efflux system)
VPVFTELPARTDASDSVLIRARVKAFVLTQNYVEGTVVKAGQVLFTLDKSEYEGQLKRAEAELVRAQPVLAEAQDSTGVDAAQADLGVARALLNETDRLDYDDSLGLHRADRAAAESKHGLLNAAKANHKARVEAARAAVEMANAGIQRARLNLEYCTIVAPTDGLAGAPRVSAGNLVGNGEYTVLTTVSNINPIRFVVDISKVDYVKYEILRAQGNSWDGADDPVLILADGSRFSNKGRIITPNRALDLGAARSSLLVEFPNPEGHLPPPAGRVRLAVGIAEDALLVPQGAVIEKRTSKMVYVVGADDKVALRSIILGERVGPDYIVKSGIHAGERIITEGIQQVHPGDAVNPINDSVSPGRSPADQEEPPRKMRRSPSPALAIFQQLPILSSTAGADVGAREMGGMEIYNTFALTFHQVTEKRTPRRRVRRV